MTAVEIVVLIVAVIVSIALLGRIGGIDFFGHGTVGDKSVRGRLRSRAERASIDRDRDLTNYTSRGGHRQDPPGLRKPPNEGGLL